MRLVACEARGGILAGAGAARQRSAIELIGQMDIDRWIFEGVVSSDTCRVVFEF